MSEMQLILNLMAILDITNHEMYTTETMMIPREHTDVLIERQAKQYKLLFYNHRRQVNKSSSTVLGTQTHMF